FVPGGTSRIGGVESPTRVFVRDERGLAPSFGDPLWPFVAKSLGHSRQRHRDRDHTEKIPDLRTGASAPAASPTVELSPAVGDSSCACSSPRSSHSLSRPSSLLSSRPRSW